MDTVSVHWTDIELAQWMDIVWANLSEQGKDTALAQWMETVWAQ
jgi:hypothetical protein